MVLKPDPVSDGLVDAVLVAPGCGTALGMVAIAYKILRRIFRFRGLGGTSGSGITLLKAATGADPDEIIELAREFLVRKDLLDWHVPLIDQKTGMFRGRTVEKIFERVFGDAKLEDLKIPFRGTCVSMDTKGRPGVIDSIRHNDLLQCDTARVLMAIQTVFSLGRLRRDNARKYGDGGMLLNCPQALWDDRFPKIPTVVIRFDKQPRPFDIEDLMEAVDGDGHYHDYEPVKNEFDVVETSFNTMLSYASASWPSRKGPGLVLELILPSVDSMDFNLGTTDVIARENMAREVTENWVRARTDWLRDRFLSS